jgi:nucleoside-diphosphate-sugar epimerase
MVEQELNTIKTIFITGATGKVGSRLVQRLIGWGYKVRALVRETSNTAFLKNLGAELVIGNLLNPEMFKGALVNVDAVIHLATFYEGATDEQSRIANINGTEILAKSSIESRVRHFIFTSSNRVYGANRNKLVTENDATQPSDNKFALAKVEIENLLQQIFKNSNISLCILRLSLVYGEGDAHLKETISFLSNWQPAKRVQMVHHADIAQAVKLSLAQNAKGIYNVTDDAPITISELRYLHGVPDTADGQISDNWEMIVSNRKIRTQLGFKPIYPTFYSAYDAGSL